MAFVPQFCLGTESYRPLLTEGIQARYFVPMHLQGSSPQPDFPAMARYFPNAIILDQEMESWLMPR